MILRYALFTFAVSVVPLYIILQDLRYSNFVPRVILDSVSQINFDIFNKILSTGIFAYFTTQEVIEPGTNGPSGSASHSLFTEEELKLFTGNSKDKKLYLAILGNVFDVTKAAKYYGPGETYNAFTGKLNFCSGTEIVM